MWEKFTPTSRRAAFEHLAAQMNQVAPDDALAFAEDIGPDLISWANAAPDADQRATREYWKAVIGAMLLRRSVGDDAMLPLANAELN
jgi:hypothetical protein